MTSFAEDLAQHRRLSILKLLHDGGGKANESILLDCLEQLGLSAGLTRQAVREDIKFLEERNCVTVTYYGDKLMVAHITERGAYVALGKEIVDGVKKPSVWSS